MTKLKPYREEQKAKEVKPKKPKASGIACPQSVKRIKCKGEMMIIQPEEKHPELDGLKRAICNKCAWRGWV